MGQIIGALRHREPQDFGPACFIGTEGVLTIKHNVLFSGSHSLNICLKSATYKEVLSCSVVLCHFLGIRPLGSDNLCHRVGSPSPWFSWSLLLHFSRIQLRVNDYKGAPQWRSKWCGKELTVERLNRTECELDRMQSCFQSLWFKYSSAAQFWRNNVENKQLKEWLGGYWRRGERVRAGEIFHACMDLKSVWQAEKVVNARVLCPPTPIWKKVRELHGFVNFSSAFGDNRSVRNSDLLQMCASIPHWPQELSSTEERIITNSYQMAACILLGAELQPFTHLLILSTFIDHLIREGTESGFGRWRQLGHLPVPAC